LSKTSSLLPAPTHSPSPSNVILEIPTPDSDTNNPPSPSNTTTLGLVKLLATTLALHPLATLGAGFFGVSVAHADADADADADVALDAADCARAPTAMYAVARRNGRAGTMVVGDGC
jgi:hypothetical protein